MENILSANINIRELAEAVTIGPQSEVQDLIDDFNSSYVRRAGDVRWYNLQAPTKSLGITRKFYWKPGAYDTIKDI